MAQVAAVAAASGGPGTGQNCFRFGFLALLALLAGTVLVELRSSGSRFFAATLSAGSLVRGSLVQEPGGDVEEQAAAAKHGGGGVASTSSEPLRTSAGRSEQLSSSAAPADSAPPSNSGSSPPATTASAASATGSASTSAPAAEATGPDAGEGGGGSGAHMGISLTPVFGNGEGLPWANVTWDIQYVERRAQEVAIRRAGLYTDKEAHTEFVRVLLLTSASTKDFSFYQNWECSAAKLGLDWAVVALDGGVYHRLGTERAIPASGHKPEPYVSFSKVDAHRATTAKLMSVLRVMKLTGLDVIYADTDHVFISDPFKSGVSLGDLIRAQRYDFVFLPDLQQRPDRDYKCQGDSGQSGLFFVSPARKPGVAKGLISAVVAELDRRLQVCGVAEDGREIFWEIIRKLSEGSVKGVLCSALCGGPPRCGGKEHEVLQICNVDPFNHGIGEHWEDVRSTLASYGALAGDPGGPGRKEQLRKMKLWDIPCPSGYVAAAAPVPEPPEALGVQLEHSKSLDVPLPDETQTEFAELVRARAGLYIDKAAHPEFSNVILITAANMAYFKFYENWACAATKLGLDWAVVANDEEVREKLGSKRTLPVTGRTVNAMVGWGDVRLDYVGRNKMMTALLVMGLTGLDILFTDADNVFIRDPFVPGVSLGDLLRSGTYDYIYQPELQKRPPPGYKSPGDGGNTGFFYASPKRKSASMQGLFRAVVSMVDLKLCLINRGAADQAIFWQVFNQLRNTRGKACGDFPCGGFKCVRMCGQPASCEAPQAETLEFCPMDPVTHPTGWENAVDTYAEHATYHANYAANELKIEKLQKMHLWDLCSKLL